MRLGIISGCSLAYKRTESGLPTITGLSSIPGYIRFHREVLRHFSLGPTYEPKETTFIGMGKIALPKADGGLDMQYPKTRDWL